MTDTVQIELWPLGRSFSVKKGVSLHEVLFDHGVEFPCGGRGRCKGCKIKLLDGKLPASEPERKNLSSTELSEGWRLACCGRADGDLKLELAQWEAPVLSDDSKFEFVPREGLGVAIDLGTTTLVAQLLDLRTGYVLGVRTALNSQAQHGADIMSRIEFGVQGQGQAILQSLIRNQLGELIRDLLRSTSGHSSNLQEIVLVGNSVMHHAFCGIDLAPLAHYPFEPLSPGLQRFQSGEVGWEIPSQPSVRFLPCLGSFVGSDILAGIIATRLHEQEAPTALIDLGTNGEIVVGNRHRMLCSSTAAGPAFEGARIAMGMRAATGAISGVRIQGGTLDCQVIGGGAPRGICGSGLVDAIAAALELGWINAKGRFVARASLDLTPEVKLCQRDVRELQLAKGAIAAGLNLLLGQLGLAKSDLRAVHLAGAFGNYINHASAQRIGLLDLPAEIIRPAGNTALLGAKLQLFNGDRESDQCESIVRRVQHVSLKDDPNFQEAFVQEMGFPEPRSLPGSSLISR